LSPPSCLSPVWPCDFLRPRLQTLRFFSCSFLRSVSQTNLPVSPRPRLLFFGLSLPPFGDPNIVPSNRLFVVVGLVLTHRLFFRCRIPPLFVSLCPPSPPPSFYNCLTPPNGHSFFAIIPCLIFPFFLNRFPCEFSKDPPTSLFPCCFYDHFSPPECSQVDLFSSPPMMVEFASTVELRFAGASPMLCRPLFLGDSSCPFCCR